WQPVTQPGVTKPGETASPVTGFAASGHTWFVVNEDHHAFISRNEGATWTPVDLQKDVAHSSKQAQALAVAGPAVAGPDGSFYVGATVNFAGAGPGVPEILRITPGGTVSRLWVRLPPSDFGAQPLPYFDSQHHLSLELDRNAKKGLLISVAQVDSKPKITEPD